MSETAVVTKKPVAKKKPKAKSKKTKAKGNKRGNPGFGQLKGKDHPSYNRTKESGELLTARQTEVLRLVSLGCDAGSIATLLELAVSTVDNHKAAGMAALGVNKATLLVRKLIKMGVTKADETLTRTEQAKLGPTWVDGWNRV